MTVTEKIRLAVCDGNAGVTFTAAQIIALVLAAYPETNPASITVSDRAQSDKQAKPYSDYLFARVAGGYEVLAPEARTLQTSGRKASQNAEMTLAQAKALIAAHEATKAAQTVVVEPDKANGATPELSDSDLEALTAPTN